MSSELLQNLAQAIEAVPDSRSKQGQSHPFAPFLNHILDDSPSPPSAGGHILVVRKRCRTNSLRSDSHANVFVHNIKVTLTDYSVRGDAVFAQRPVLVSSC